MVPIQILTWVHFPTACLAFVSLSLWTPTDAYDSFAVACLTKLTLIIQPCGPKDMLTWVHFPSAWFLKFYWCSFRSASGHQHTYGTRFACSTKLTLMTQSWGPKQILTWVHFPSAWFLKFYWRSFRSAFGHQHRYRIRFPWPARPN